MGGDRPLWPILAILAMPAIACYTDGMKNKRSRKRMQGKPGREVGRRVTICCEGLSAAEIRSGPFGEEFMAVEAIRRLAASGDSRAQEVVSAGDAGRRVRLSKSVSDGLTADLVVEEERVGLARMYGGGADCEKVDDS